MRWDKSADVVIIGYGLAGVATGITAHDDGAEVLILEKQPEDGFYNSSTLSGGIFTGSSDIKGTIQYINGLNRVNEDLYWTDREIIRVWAEYTFENKSWFEKLGGKVRLLAKGGGEHPELPGCETIELYQYRGSGYRMMNFLYDKVRSRNIEVMHGIAARKLFTNHHGEIVGVKVERMEGGERRNLNIRANKAVILACGGFGFNEEMKLQYLKVYPSYFYGTPANTGDGIKMALDVGADLWHMNCCSARLIAKFPEFPWGFTVEFGGKGWSARLMQHKNDHEPAGYLLVDRHGKRFTSEDVKLHCLYYELSLFDSHGLEYPRIPSYWIFDSKRMESGTLAVTIAGPAGPQRLYRWSLDNSEELKRGWIISGRSVRELAGKLELPADTLEKTLAAYNQFCEAGNDPEFNRRSGTLVPLDNPPYFAVKLWPGGANTQGGPRRNTRSQVLNTDGDPIGGLYCVGELGSVNGMLLLNGGNLGECIAFGRVAGENAAKEKPRKV